MSDQVDQSLGLDSQIIESHHQVLLFFCGLRCIDTDPTICRFVHIRPPCHFADGPRLSPSTTYTHKLPSSSLAISIVTPISLPTGIGRRLQSDHRSVTTVLTFGRLSRYSIPVLTHCLCFSFGLMTRQSPPWSYLCFQSADTVTLAELKAETETGR